MNAKPILLVLATFCLTLTTYAQLKVHSDGTVSIGTLTSSGYACTISGYAALKLEDGSSYIRFTPTSSYGVIGSQSNNIYLWTDASIGYNDLRIEDLTETSDSLGKTNIAPLQSGMELVMQLKPKSYNRKDGEGVAEAQTSYGFLAQDVALINPDLVEYGVDSSLGLHTTQIIPYLVSAIQEQQVQIDSLANRVTELERSVYDGGIGTKSAGVNTTEDGQFVELGQNNPNPFKESTVIPYTIPESAKSAQIIVYDMRGEQLKAYELGTFGEGQLVIEGSTFKAGMYMYALIVDGEYIDTKRMILSK